MDMKRSEENVELQLFQTVCVFINKSRQGHMVRFFPLKHGFVYAFSNSLILRRGRLDFYSQATRPQQHSDKSPA